MIRVAAALILFLLYAGYSVQVYSRGTRAPAAVSAAWNPDAAKGKRLFQQYNCTACHQVFGLGGYLGPDLTNAWSDPRRGPAYLEAMLRSGGSRMPNFHFRNEEVRNLLAYLRQVDAGSKDQP